MSKAIYFDMDGTLDDLYGVDGWLESLRKSQTKPYREAKSLQDMKLLSNLLLDLQALGYHIGIVSWGSKQSTEEYLERVRTAKIKWLQKHMGRIIFDEIKIVQYGTPKSSVVDFKDGILFDDEQQNRENWEGTSYDETNILEILSGLVLDEVGLL